MKKECEIDGVLFLKVQVGLLLLILLTSTPVIAEESTSFEVPDDPLARAELIIELDRELTSHSENYIISGDEYWKKQYDLIGVKLDKVIKKAKEESDSSYLTKLFEKQDEANLKLVEIELRSHELVKNYKREEAKKLIEGEEYKKWKKIYSETINDYLIHLGVEDSKGISEKSKSTSTFASNEINKKAYDVAKQLELYLESHPELTLEELKKDFVFRELAIQQVGDTGYTYLVVYETGVLEFHPDSDIEGTSYTTFKERFPKIYKIIDNAVNSPSCSESSGFYEWEDIRGEIREKYTFHKCLNIKTNDGYTLFVGASTYLDEYQQTEEGFNYNLVIFPLIILVLIFLVVFLFTKFLKGKKLTKKTILQFMGVSLIPLIIFSSAMYFLNSQKDEGIGSFFRDKFEGQSHKAEEDKLDLVGDYIIRQVKGYENRFRLLASDERYKSILSEADLTGELKGKSFYPSEKSQDWIDVQKKFIDSYNSQPNEIDMVRIFHKNGYIVNGVALGEEDKEDYKGDKSWFKDTLNPNVLKRGDVYISPISLARRTQSPAIRYSAPIEVGGERLGLFVINFRSESITQEVENYRFEETGFAALVDYSYETAEGNILEWPVLISISTRDAFYMIDESEEAKFFIGKDLLKGNKGEINLEYLGEDYHGHYKKLNLEGKEWYLFVLAPREEVFSVLNDAEKELKSFDEKFLFYFLGLFALLLIISMILGIYFSKKVSDPLVELTNASNEIQKGNLDARTEIKTGDELEDLGNSFNLMAESLARSDEERKRVDKMKTEFISITSHELRSPMTPMKAQLQMLSREYFGKLNKKQKNAIDIVLRNTIRLDGILVDFLEISRIEAARLKFNFVKTNLDEPIKNLINEMKGYLPEKKIEIILKKEKLPVFEVDPNRVMQVLRNLLNNAKKFSPANSKIVIEVKNKGSEIEISVKDKGIGIPLEAQSRVFEPFYQAEQTMYRKYGGTGLGLAICKGIVESQNGKIWLESQPNKGTTFSFTVPFEPVRDIKPIKLLFSSKAKVEGRLKEAFVDFLGPLGKNEFDLIKGNLSQKRVEDYLIDLKNKNILDRENYDLFLLKIKTIYGVQEELKVPNEIKKIYSEMLGKSGEERLFNLKNLTMDEVIGDINQLEKEKKINEKEASLFRDKIIHSFQKKEIEKRRKNNTSSRGSLIGERMGDKR